ncbi:MAG: hypothetical protein RLZZ458_1504, partial [Planctomycetota bacterium]
MNCLICSSRLQRKLTYLNRPEHAGIRFDLISVQFPLSVTQLFPGSHSGLSGSKAGDGDAAWGAADVVESDFVAEVDGLGIAAMFAANTDLEIRTDRATVLDGGLHQATYAGLIDGLERVCRDDVVFGVVTDEGLVVVAADTEAGLGEVIGTKAEELGSLRNLGAGHGCSWHFDHGADHVVHLNALFSEYLFGSFADDGGLVIHFGFVTGERNHDFGVTIDAGLFDGAGSFDDGASLHGGDFGIDDPEPTATMSEHRVGFLEFVDASVHLFFGDVEGAGEFAGERGIFVEVMFGEEFVEWWVEQSDGDGTFAHGFEEMGEVVALEGE